MSLCGESFAAGGSVEKPTVTEESSDNVGAEPWTIADKGSFLLVEFSGQFSTQAGKQCVDAMVEACVKLGRSKVLLDCRRIQGELPIFARFEVTEYGASKRQHLRQLALVSRPEVALPDNFVENVAVNRGMNMRVFTDFDQALRWITEETSTS